VWEPVLPHFLMPLVGSAPSGWALRNERTGLTICSVLVTAFDSRARRRGLLGQNSLSRDAAVILAPCGAVHTWFMRFPIDVLFVDEAGIVRKVCPRVGPWRFAMDLRAFATVELAAGLAREADTRPGDRLSVSKSGRTCDS
jgi:uncharacterized membrane protein (UPF0127 family)